MVNYQSELPNVPVFNLSIEMNLPAKFAVKTARCVSDFQNVLMRKIDRAIKIELPRLDNFEIIEIEKG